MPYQQGYPQGQYADYSAYGHAPQMHMYQANHMHFPQQQHPVVSVPQQPRPDASHFQTSPHLSQSQQLPGPQQPLYDQYAGYYPQAQQFNQQSVQQQHFQLQSQRAYQAPYQRPQSQTSYQQPSWSQPLDLNFRDQAGNQYPVPYQQQPSPQLNYRPQHQPTQNSPQINQHRPSTQLHQAPRYAQSQPQSLPVQTSPQINSNGPRPQQQVNKQPQMTSSSSYQSQPQQRMVARVEIPGQTTDSQPSHSEMARSPKRRRSNEGHAMPVCDVPVPQKRTVSHQPKHTPVSSSPLTELNSSQLPPTPQPNVDYQAVLLALADEYTAAAYSISSSVVTSEDFQERSKEYYQLISTAMGCLESVLQNYRQSDPRKEAQIRLRLASMLVEETENDQEAEEVLSKGISLCERSRLHDVKYTMHHLLVRIMFKSNPKAALKTLDKLAQEVETLGLTHWVYIFRFMRVSLGLQIEGHSDTAASLKHLTAISSSAKQLRQVAVQIIATVLEAVVHIRSGALDAVELAQRAMASARTHQLGPEMQKMPQVRALLDCLDLACCLLQFNPDQVAEKMQQMQSNMETSTRDNGWNRDGSIHVPLVTSANEALHRDTCGILRRSDEGNAVLIMQWLTRSQMFMLGYLLSGMANIHKNSSDGRAEKFLNEGLKLANVAPSTVLQSLAAAANTTQRQASLTSAIRLHLIFACAGRYDWASAHKAINEMRIENILQGLEPDESTGRTLLYLEGVCVQGMGELQSALELFQSPTLAFEPDSKASGHVKDIAALACLNRIFILRAMGTDEYANAENLLSTLEPYCISHPNKAIHASHNIVKATSQGPNNAIIKTKQFLQSAVAAAKAASNNQLLTIVMNVMTASFFTNIVGDQAQKSAGAGRSLARKTHDKLWMAVADGMFGDILERCGKPAEAEATRKEARSLMPDLPESLRNSLQIDGT